MIKVLEISKYSFNVILRYYNVQIRVKQMNTLQREFNLKQQEEKVKYSLFQKKVAVK